MNNKLLQKLAGVIALCCLFLITWTAQAQERKVTGKVLSAADGQGLPGASVMVKGTKVGLLRVQVESLQSQLKELTMYYLLRL
jgi:ABC-type transporter Mla subunit MlaD